MSIKTNELQQIIAPQSEDSILMASAAAGTGQLTMARAAEFFGAELIKPTNPVGASLSQKADVEPLTWYDLPLASGFSADPTYRLPQYTVTKFGTIIIASGVITRTDADYGIHGNPIAAMMPEGYRPKAHIRTSAGVTSIEGGAPKEAASAYVNIAPGGAIQLQVRESLHCNMFLFPTIMFD